MIIKYVRELLKYKYKMFLMYIIFFLISRCNINLTSFYPKVPIRTDFIHYLSLLNTCFYFPPFQQEEELRDAILVILANKQDMENCMTVAEVHRALGLENLKDRTFQIFKTSAKEGEGLNDSMDWLSNALHSKL